MAKLSIIMPVYNAENTLYKAVESVLQQSFSDFILFLVDDGSTDRSLEICRFFSQKDNRVLVKHQKNMGPSMARNAALDLVQSEYIAFMDADDYLESNMYETLIQTASYADSDLTMCGYQRDFFSSEKLVRSQKVSLPSMQINDQKRLKECFNQLYLHNYIHLVWNKLYLTKIILDNNIRFRANIDNGEDLLFNLDYIRHTSNMYLCSEILYHYISNETVQSLTSSSSKNAVEAFDNKVYLYQEVHSFLRDCLNMHESEMDKCADSDIFLRDCFRIMDTFRGPKATVKSFINHPATQLALESKGCGEKEFLLYRIVLRLKSIPLIYCVSYLRLLAKKVLRGEDIRAKCKK